MESVTEKNYWITMQQVADEQLRAAKAETQYWEMKYMQENRMQYTKP